MGEPALFRLFHSAPEKSLRYAHPAHGRFHPYIDELQLIHYKPETSKGRHLMIDFRYPVTAERLRQIMGYRFFPPGISKAQGPNAVNCLGIPGLSPADDYFSLCLSSPCTSASLLRI